MSASGLLEQLPVPPAGRTGWPWDAETGSAPFATAPAGGWPKISIVCPSFRQGRFIEETIRSVLLQNYPQLEFIIMDGGSQDETVAILQQYSPWLTHWESQPDRGQSHALNKGFARATGALYGWINSDDYYLPSAFAAVARAYQPGRRKLYFGDWYEQHGEEAALRSHRERPAFRFQVAVGGRTLPSHATFWSAGAHQPFNEALRFTLDAEFFKRLAACGVRPLHVPQALGVFRQHAAAKSSTIVNVAQAETEAWSRAQPWHTHWRWRVSRLLDRFRH
ncbi:MAG: glycosyltransferase family 2 protein [Opitutaceae bacterium]|nr:glycosyltransferase family 2 protein [Opitutaceae bacterium]